AAAAWAPPAEPPRPAKVPPPPPPVAAVRPRGEVCLSPLRCNAIPGILQSSLSSVLLSFLIGGNRGSRLARRAVSSDRPHGTAASIECWAQRRMQHRLSTLLRSFSGRDGDRRGQSNRGGRWHRRSDRAVPGLFV